MKIGFAELFRHRPFQIAWVWEMLCLASGFYCILALKNDGLGIGLIFAGVIPVGIVMVLFVQAKKAALANPAPVVDRSKDIVQ